MIKLENYFKETSVRVKKFGLWLKGMIGLAAASAYIQADAKIAFYLMVGGAILTGLLELLPPDEPQNSVAAPAAPPVAVGGVVAVMLALFICISGCTVLKPEVDRTKTDTTITTYKQVSLKVTGAKVFAGLNMDSLYRAALVAKDQRSDDSVARLNLELKYKQDSISALKANKPIPQKPVFITSPPVKQYVTDPQTKAQLAYWIDQYGKFQITCESKDQTIQTLQAQVTKLTKDTTTTTKVDKVTPVWAEAVMIAEGILLVITVLIIVFKKLI